MITKENGGKLKILGERILRVGFNERSMLAGRKLRHTNVKYKVTFLIFLRRKWFTLWP